MAWRGQRFESDRVALAVALLLHGAAWFGLRAFAGVRPLPQPAPLAARAPFEEVDIELSPPVNEAEGSGELPARDVSSPLVALRAAARPTKSSSAAKASARESPPGDVLAAPEAPTNDNAPAATGAERPIDLGLGADGWQRWALAPPKEPGPSQPMAPRGRPLIHPAPASTTGGLQEGLEAHDRKLGMGPSGRVATALYQAAHTDVAPQTGSASFTVTVLRSGEVQVAVGSASDAKWHEVAQRAAEELRRAPPRIPEPRNGYRVSVHITALETMPNGLKRSELRSAHLEAVPLRFHDVKTEQKQLALDNPTAVTGPDRRDPTGTTPITMDVPGVFITGQGKVCKYAVGLSLTGIILQGGCDPVNAGAKLQRVVRTQVSEETAF